jgi:hypothetical protein
MSQTNKKNDKGPEPFNIVDLIEKDTSIRLVRTYQTALITKIQNNFNPEEQQLFVASFYCYLKYDSKKDFVIDFNDVWKWCGFSRKEEGKRLLKKHFVEGVDYKVEIFAPPIGGKPISEDEEKEKSAQSEESIGFPAIGGKPISEDEYKEKTAQSEESIGFPPIGGKPNVGGRPKEKIVLTVNTFKKFCMKAGTKKADEVHEYYIKLEELLQETLKEQSDELQKQLEQKEKQLEFKNEVIRLTKADSDKYKSSYHQMVKVHDSLKLRRNYHKFKQGKCCYIISDKWREKLYYKFGETDDINTRLQNYRCSMPDCRIEFLVYLNDSSFLEKAIKYKYSKNLTSLNHEYVTGIPLVNIIETFKKFIKELNFEATFENNLSDYNDPYSETEETTTDFSQPSNSLSQEETHEEKNTNEELDEKEEVSDEIEEVLDDKEEVLDEKEENLDEKEDFTINVKHTCEVCQKSYRNHGKLMNHKLAVHGIEDTTDYTICQTCSKKFSCKDKMLRHVRTVHYKSTQVNCPDCYKVFATTTSLNFHIKQVHTKEKSIKCDQCDKVCVSKGSLKRHIETIHDKIKIQCKECGKSILSCNMTHHINLVHKRTEVTECTLCKAVLASNIGMKYHMNFVHGINVATKPSSASTTK